MGLAQILNLVLWISVAAAQLNPLYPLFSFNLQAPYIDDTLGNRHWDFGGNAIVDIAKHIRLTQDLPSQNGWLWSKRTINERAFQIEFEYKISGHGTTISGDGMAFWLTSERAETGPVFGNRQRFHGLGVFFDTYPNTPHRYPFPYVMGMLGDGSKDYEPGNDGAKTELAGCPADIRRKDYPTKCRIKYVRGRYVEVLLNNVDDGADWKTCFRVNVSLPDQLYIGFTALTGALSDNHDVIKVTAETFSENQADTSKDFVAKHGEDYKSFISFSFGINFHSFIYGTLKFIAWVFALVVILYVVFRVYSKRKRQSFKHF